MKNLRHFPLIMFATLLAVVSCGREEAQVVEGPPELIGYWQFVDHTGPNELTFTSVPSDDGLTAMEKSQMLEFRLDGVFGQFFWNWCGTPPAMPSDWRYGTWEQITESPIRIQLQWDDDDSYFQVFEILQLEDGQLVTRWEN